MFGSRRRLTVHAGLHKTGTTAVQAALASSAEWLGERRLLYPLAGRPRAVGPERFGHHNIAWQLAGDRRHQPGFGTVDDVAAEVAGFPGDAILSSEDSRNIPVGRTRCSVMRRRGGTRRHCCGSLSVGGSRTTPCPHLHEPIYRAAATPNGRRR